MTDGIGEMSFLGVKTATRRVRRITSTSVLSGYHGQGLTQSSSHLSQTRGGRRTRTNLHGRIKAAQKEIGASELVLTDLLIDGASWSPRQGLHIDQSISGFVQLPPLRVHAATPRAAEFLTHQKFPQAHGSLKLAVHRVLQSPWPVRGSGHGISHGTTETMELFSICLPCTWANPTQRGLLVSVYDALPPCTPLESLCNTSPPKRGSDTGSPPGSVADGAADTGASTVEDPMSPSAPTRPFGFHPTAAVYLAGPSPATCATLEED